MAVLYRPAIGSGHEPTGRRRHQRDAYTTTSEAAGGAARRKGPRTADALSTACPVLRAARRADALGVHRVFKALADRHGVRILNRLLLASGEAVCVGEFEDMLGLEQLTVSYHLNQLLDAGIVTREKRGSYAYFSSSPPPLSGSATSSPYPPQRSPPNGTLQVAREPTAKVRPAVGDDLAAMTALYNDA